MSRIPIENKINYTPRHQKKVTYRATLVKMHSQMA